MHLPEPDKKPGVIIAGLSGGSGKTVISLGIIGAWRQAAKKVAPYKKGPDYIDAGWLSKAAGRPCYNLDTYMCPSKTVTDSYIEHSFGCDVAVVEGNRGLYDGIDTDGSTSTAELAKLLHLPVILILDCTKATRTMAALLRGCIDFDPDLTICGVILNRVAGKRHEEKVRTNIEKYCHVPVFGAIPKLSQEDFPERHMGLLTSDEHVQADQAIQAAIQVARSYIDLDALYVTLNQHCSPVVSEPRTHPSVEQPPEQIKIPFPESVSVTIGIIRDSAFQFYYPDNIDALRKKGAKIVYISPLTQTTIPEVDAIYMGGGFPETHARKLAENIDFKNQFRALALKGLPIYAECGGLIYLGDSICLDDIDFPMTGIFPVTFGLSKKPEGHGYTKVKVVNDNPFFPAGMVLKGHEFRYSKILHIDYTDDQMAFRMDRGKGIIEKKDGLFRYNTFGTYTHLHALGTPSWVEALIRQAVSYKRSR